MYPNKREYFSNNIVKQRIGGKEVTVVKKSKLSYLHFLNSIQMKSIRLCCKLSVFEKVKLIQKIYAPALKIIP